MKTPISGKMFEICAVLEMIYKKFGRVRRLYVTQYIHRKHIHHNTLTSENIQV